MGGFPNRPDLATFGPRAVDTRPVRDPSREATAAQWNLLRFQAAGLGLVSPRAFVRFSADDPPVIVEHFEAWNTDGSFPAPELERIDVGRYSVTFASAAVDADGASVPVSFSGALGFCTTSPVPDDLVFVQAGLESPNVLTVKIKGATGEGLVDVDGHEVALVIW